MKHLGIFHTGALLLASCATNKRAAYIQQVQTDIPTDIEQDYQIRHQTARPAHGDHQQQGTPNWQPCSTRHPPTTRSTDSPPIRVPRTETSKSSPSTKRAKSSCRSSARSIATDSRATSLPKDRKHDPRKRMVHDPIVIIQSCRREILRPGRGRPPRTVLHHQRPHLALSTPWPWPAT